MNHIGVMHTDKIMHTDMLFAPYTSKSCWLAAALLTRVSSAEDCCVRVDCSAALADSEIDLMVPCN